MSDMRGYTRVTPEMEARILAMREVMGTASYADIAAECGYPERTIKYVLTDLPRLRRVNAGEAKAKGSLKDRVFEAIKGAGPIRDVTELRRIVGMADTDHDVMHVLHSLHTQGRIDFDERGNGMGTATCVNIRLHKKSQKVRLRPDPEAQPEILTFKLPTDTVDAGIPFEQLPESQPEVETYPLLDLLLQQERARLEGDSKGMAYVVAAEAIQSIDPGTAASLMAMAKQYDVPFPSPIEAEYLRYVATHPNKENA